MIIITPLWYLSISISSASPNNPPPQLETHRLSCCVRLLLLYYVCIYLLQTSFSFQDYIIRIFTIYLIFFFLLFFIIRICMDGFYLWCIQLKIVDNCDHCKLNMEMGHLFVDEEEIILIVYMLLSIKSKWESLVVTYPSSSSSPAPP